MWLIFKLVCKRALSPAIHILPDSLVSKIAAGEIVSRPASVVKELLENSVDGGATRIVVTVRDGGKSFIQVADDGCGMGEEDAKMAFSHHATSKISSYSDLENIRTLGFRGEALFSIVAISQAELKTRTAASEIGTMIRIEGGEAKELSQVAMEPGTTVTVKNLFFNVPARRNFLKSTLAEFKHISDAVQRTAVSRCELGLTFVSSDEKVLEVRPETLDARLKSVFGGRAVDSLIEFREDSEFLRIHGFTTKPRFDRGAPEFARKTRGDQLLFLNGRFIVNRALNHAVFSAYEHLLEKGSFPFFVLFLEIDPHRVDVNVHPSKLEVKFDDERSAYRFVHSAVRKALGSHDLVPSVEMKSAAESGGESAGKEPGVGLRFAPGSKSAGPGTDAPDVDATLAGLFSGFKDRFDSTPPLTEDIEPMRRAIRPEEGVGRPVPPEEGRKPEGVVTGRPLVLQIHRKYIVLQISTGLMIIDQHVAHERVLYERIVAGYEDEIPQAQQLLFPQTLLMTPADYSLIRELMPHLQRMGFDLKLFGKNTVVVEGVPADVRVGREEQILQQVLDLFKENEQEAKLDARDALAKSFACRAAVKAGDELHEAEIRALIRQLVATQMPYVCPHGRPIMIRISTEELDKRFGRT